MFLGRNVIRNSPHDGVARRPINKRIAGSGYDTVERGPPVMSWLLALLRHADLRWLSPLSREDRMSLAAGEPTRLTHRKSSECSTAFGCRALSDQEADI